MNIKKRPVVLYFTAGMFPTEDEINEGLAMNAKFRNSQLVTAEDREVADFVAGNVPELEHYQSIPVYGEESSEVEPTDGEPIGDFYLHQVKRGEWFVLDEEGVRLNDEPLNKADARALALEHTED